MSIHGKFQRQTLQEAFGRDTTTIFGVNVFNSLLLNKEWIVFILTPPYFNFRDDLYKSDQLDIFYELTSYELDRLKHNSNTFFIMNYSWEGTSYKEYNFWEMLTCSALRHNIPLEKIFFISSNLKDEEQYDIWQKENFPNNRINVIVFDFFSDYASHYLQFLNHYTIDHAVNKIKEDHKFFLSLNRRTRTFRVYTVYKIFESSIYNKTMISYDRLELQHITKAHDDIIPGVNINPDTYKRLIDSSPSVLDFSNFNDNWAGHPTTAAMPVPLFENTIVSLISETLFDTYDNTSLFYSEKTFKAMIYYHPIMIFGQPRLNTSLEQIGFKSYNNYFDLSFDNIENHATRIDTQITQLEILKDKLVCMHPNQRADWAMQDRGTLEHNKEALREQVFNKKQLQKLIEIVKTISE
jgi:hypothetical protein